MSAPTIPFDCLSEIASRQGLHIFSVIGAEQAEKALRRESESLSDWQQQGYAGEMAYMCRDVELFATIRHFLPEVRSIISFVVPYTLPSDVLEAGRQAGRQRTPLGFGRVARYAWGRDYHRVIKRKLKALVKAVEAAAGGEAGLLRYRSFSDAVPLLERGLARAGGLGFAGKNTMLIRPGLGSFTFIAELIWTVEVSGAASAAKPLPSIGCGSCRRCCESCPTGAIVADHRIDARKCISYLTIEKRGMLDEQERREIGEWIFGCDVCQDVCPFNHPAITRGSIEEFGPAAGAGPLLDLGAVLSLDTVEKFTKHFAGTPLMRSGREGLLRNACCVAANTGALSTVPALIAALGDNSPVIGRHAAWALSELSPAADRQTRSEISSALRVAGRGCNR